MSQHRFLIIVDLRSEDDVEVSINATRGTPFPATVAATEHMMTMCATTSPQGDFEKALRLLVKGARSNNVTLYKGHKKQ